ncbi:MAG: succinylglutamate desuccinylase/aspartoacylase family protein [Salinisphaeraceae bacterium]|nr:succinylglutamate desuccinylase/aspartoacylase family protein [Salinisphaeraceae bacterium]
MPDRFLTTPAKGLHKLLGGPSLIHIPGPGAPLFVSTLLHGNETTGIEALQDLLSDYAHKPLPRGLLIFIGNTAAAAKGQRLLPGQPDFNRIWPDANGEAQPGVPTEAAELAELVMQKVLAHRPCAVLDLHNTSGRNPPHACINVMRGDCIELAGHFAQRVLYFTRPKGVMSMAFAPHCAAVTVESGAVNMPQHSQLTLRYLKYVLEHGAPVQEPLDSNDDSVQADVALFRSMARVELQDGVEAAIGPDSADVQLVADIDGYNWREIPVGTLLAQCDSAPNLSLRDCFRVTSPEGEDLTGEYLALEERRIVTKRTLTPAMLSTNIDIIQQDCLCYFLERVC